MPQQLKSLLVVFALLIGGLVTARHFLLPPTFGERGHYRAAAVGDIEKLPIRYAGREVCATCHDEIAATHGKARHQTLACEVCHGPAAAHVENPVENKLTAPRERAYCTLCHGYDPSRPTGFPQIDPVAHNPLRACITCHNPHQPEPPHVPDQCSACHGEIARTKAVSRHALLECTQCHATPVQHKVKPREVRPEKPRTREFCGSCHAQDAKPPKSISQSVPRINLETHGGRYVCWQCHYPHLPEAR